MKHKVKITVETKKKGLFGTKTVREEKTVWVDSRFLEPEGVWEQAIFGLRNDDL